MTRRPALAIFVWLLSIGVLGGLLWQAAQQGGGFAYPLDDTYIHAAVARNLASTGTWGINPGQFASAASSPVWIVLLALGFMLLGVWVWMPLALSVLGGLGALLVSENWLRKQGLSPRARLWSLLLFSAAVPLPTLMGLGMEHTLQLTLVLVLGLSPEPPAKERLPVVLAMAAMMPMVRYESCFFVGWLGLIWIVRGHRRAGVLLWAAGTSTVVLFGAWSVWHGASWIPNGLVMKSRFPTHALENLTENVREGVFVWGLALVVWGLGRRDVWASRLFLATALTHLVVADLGWFYRYEAYLLGWGMLLLAAERPAERQHWWLLGTIASVVLLAPRALDATRYLPGRCVYILDVKVRLAQSLTAVAPETRLALHDIGAMAWYSDALIVDIAGLGDDEVAHLSAAHRFTGSSIAELVTARGAVIGFAVESWMANDRPPGWEPVAQLEWALDGKHFSEPIVVYALQTEGTELGRVWIEHAASQMGHRARWSKRPAVP